MGFLLLLPLAGCAAARVATPDDAPVITAVRPPKAGPGARVRIVGRSLARDGAQTWVKFGTHYWVEAEGATEAEIVLKVPDGVATGPLQIRVGRRLGEPRPFEVVEGFSSPVPDDAVVRDADGFAVTTVSDLGVQFKDFHGFPEAEAIAKKHDATVSGYLPFLNRFTLRFKTRDLKALLEVKKAIEAEPTVETVSIQIGLRPR